MTGSEAGPARGDELDTLTEYLRAAKERNGSRNLPDVIAAIALASKSIANKVRRARLAGDVIGAVGTTNVQGEEQQKLDVIANDLLIHCLRRCPHVGVLGSEEEDEVVVVRPKSAGGDYVVLFDPLDGSSNIDVAAGVGTIFSILANDRDDEATDTAALQPGKAQVASGYVLYGSSVLMVLTLGHGVDMFVLDPDLGEFVLVQEGLQIPREKKIRSVNGAYRFDFSEGYQSYLVHTENHGYASRYIGSMVADVHRTLLKGGVFLYPPTKKAPKGKLRLMYEANPMSLLVEQAGGLASTGDGRRILDVAPGELHERTPVVLGSSAEVEKVLEFL
ncbi:MAG: class 1 fructose-bisphosphatase [Myxococcales bacterium]|nr:class 1 fructose-bisphosphatase [Myxococcales bacterium]